jgi:hypothetical protein
MRSVATALLSAAIAAQAIVASPIRARSPYVVKETHYAPHGWTKQERTKGDHVIRLQIGLKQGNFEELERHLYEGEFNNPAHCCRKSIAQLDGGCCATVLEKLSRHVSQLHPIQLWSASSRKDSLVALCFTIYWWIAAYSRTNTASSMQGWNKRAKEYG